MLPQFDTTFFPSQIFWLFVCFGILYLLIARFTLPRIAEVLSERQRRIDDDIDRAAQLKSQTEAAILAYERTLTNARLQAHEVLQQSQDEIARLVQNRNREVIEQLEVEVKAGEERISAAKQVVLGEVKEIAAAVAETAVDRLIGLTLDVSCYREAVMTVVRKGS